MGSIATEHHYPKLRGIGLMWLAGLLVGCGLLSPTPAPTPPPTSTPTPGIGSTQIAEKDGMVLMYVPAGESRMGSANTEQDAQRDEQPQHMVYLDAFWIDRTEVTNAMYAKCVKAGACQAPWNSSSDTIGDPRFDNYPVAGMTWQRAKVYCEWAGRRLPTEAEWEKAARGTDGRVYPWGNMPPDPQRLNYNANLGGTTEVGSYPAGASPYGALDMAGNLWEWVADWYDNDYYASSPPSNPPGPPPQAYHSCRGGSWNNTAPFVRAAYRGNDDPGKCDGLVGIRCAR
jgi:formylglycine-generating enzyme required for sulfatase activity